MLLGKVMSSDSHLQYRCRVYAPGEVDHPPRPTDYALGTFVRLPTGTDTDMVGVICDTILQNPAFAAYGPRLSTAEENSVFSPDYVDEACTVVTIVAVGQLRNDESIHEPSAVTPQINCEVTALTPEEVRAFHLTRQGFRIGYLPLLLSLGRSSPLYAETVLRVIALLRTLFPDGPESTRLRLLAQSMSWQTRVQRMG